MTNQTKENYTPGPWHNTHGIDDSGDVRTVNGKIICNCPNAWDGDLCAAAPELLEALKKARLVISTHGTGGQKHSDPITGEPTTPLMVEIEQAIAKAMLDK